MYKRQYLFITLCILFLTSYLQAQIKGKLVLSEDQTRYEFYIIPDFDQAPPLSTTNSAQVSIVAPVGGLEIANFESVMGQWNGADAAVIESPSENPDFSYISIPLASPMQDIVYTANQEILLFTFENVAECLGTLAIVDNESDPFLPPNSQSINIGNLFTILGFGPRNVYEGSEECCVACPEENGGGGSTPSPGQGTLCDQTKSDIEIRLTAAGTPPYIATWENTTTGKKDTINIPEINGTYILVEDAAPGKYDILLVDAVGMRLELQEEVIDNSYFLNPQLNVTDANCETMGEVEVQFIESPPVTISYEWSNGATTPKVEDLAAGEYEVTVSDNNGCTATQRASITATVGINAQVDQTNSTCAGMDDGQLAITISNPENYEFQWEGNGLTSTESTLTNLSPGTYSVTISSLNEDCSDTQSFVIEEPAALAISTQLVEESNCAPLTENTILVNAVTGTDLQYAIANEEFSSNNRFEVPTGQSYEITARDGQGCTTTASVNVPETSGISVNIPERIVLELGTEMELNIEYESINPVTIQWEDHPSLSCTDCANPTISPTETTTYTLILSDDNGCSKDATIIVFISETDKIFAPSAFSPNEDGVNDFFNIFTGNTVEAINSLQIFNRWGAQVFQSGDNYTSNINEAGWNGLYNGQAAPSGVYVYFAEVTMINGSMEIIQGEVSLLR